KLDKELREAQVKAAYFVAAKVARKLYVLQRDATGEESPQAQNRKTTLAGMLNTTGDYAEAMTLYQELLRTTGKQKGPESRETSYALMAIKGIHWVQGRYDEVEPLQQRILAITKKVEGEQSQAYAQEVMNYGMLLYSHNEYSSAERLLEQSLKIHEAVAAAKNDDGVLLGPLQALAMVYWQANERPKAIVLNDRVLAIPAKGPRVQTRAGMIMAVAGQYSYGGRDDLAAPLVKRAVELYEGEIARLEKTNPDDPMIQSYLSSLGMIYRGTADLANADKVLSRAVEL